MTSKLSNIIFCKSQTQLTTLKHRGQAHRGQEKERVERIDTKRCVDRKGTKGNPLEVIWEFIFDPTI